MSNTDTSPRPPVALAEHFPTGYEAMLALEKVVHDGPLELPLFELVKLRASQINGCAYCVDMHHKDARAGGETDQRLALLSVWREVDVFTDRERAALALTEAVTLIADAHVPAAIEEAARAEFDEATYANLVFAIAVINAWNRIAITGHTPAGRYQPRAKVASADA
jgi:AhpD family alkylhydroperoxidase